MAGTADTSIALSVTLAIALHNIPEGIAVAVPVYFATGSRKKAFFWSFVSGLAEPAGGLLGYMVFSGFERQYETTSTNECKTWIYRVNCRC